MPFVPSGYLSIHEALNRLGRELFPSAWTGEEHKARRGLISEEEWSRIKDLPPPRGGGAGMETPRSNPARKAAPHSSLDPSDLCTKRSTGPGSGTWMFSVDCASCSMPVSSRRPSWILGAEDCIKPRLHCGAGTTPIGCSKRDKHPYRVVST